MQKADLYDLLMNKPIPYKKKQHDVKINKIEILEAEDPEDQKQIVKAVVIDKTDENRVDRNDALMRIRRAKKKALEPKAVVELRKSSVIPTKLTDAEAQEEDADDLFRDDLKDDEVKDDEAKEGEPKDGEAKEDEVKDDEAKDDEAKDDEALESKQEYSVQDKSEKPKIIIDNDEKEDDEDGDVETLGKPVKAKPSKKEPMVSLSDDYVIPKVPEDVMTKPPIHILNSRENFIREINKSLASKFKHLEENESSVVSCDVRSESKFDLLTHQKIVKYYLNVFSPYRGLLLYHGLGAGKTCSSIAIAEGMKNFKRVLIMTPASLRMNYIEELKKCGDDLYKRGQYWEFINTVIKPDMIPIIKRDLGLKDKIIKANNGAWFANSERDSNYDTLSPEDKRSLDKQINEMIAAKYEFINYNGLHKKKYLEITDNRKANPFSGKVIIIDEAHNFISRIVNKIKLNKAKREDSLAYMMYIDLLSAVDCKIVLLSGTPMINYPNEIGILFNILRGYIRTLTIPLNVKNASGPVNENTIREILKDEATIDYIGYNDNTKILEITRNPFGFVNQYEGEKYVGVVKQPGLGEIDDKEFLKNIRAKLKLKKISFDGRSIKSINYTALPDNNDEFKSKFVDYEKNTSKNTDVLIRRIVGLTSYYRSAQEGLMPSYNPETDLIIEELDMSDHQFKAYSEIRAVERKREKETAKRRKKGADDDELSSTYRIFSRLFCNFVFPDEIERPLPNEKKDIAGNVASGITESAVDNVAAIELIDTDSGVMPDDVKQIEDETNIVVDVSYERRLKASLSELEKAGDVVFSNENLERYSPKFLKLLKNITETENEGKHMIYTQFRTLEGIAIIKLVLEYNGFVQFKIKRDSTNDWVLDVPESLQGKPMFALYTGTETAEEKEITRNVFNDDWNVVPEKLKQQLFKIHDTNIFGQLIKVFMITASGAEGISLRNVRFVHLVDPYWHPVRREQVIGRARRICSHNTLPPELQTVRVYLYLMKFSEKQLTSSEQESIDLKRNDRSFDGTKVFTTDQTLHEISDMKQKISNQLLSAIKQSAIDCKFHKNKGLVCYTFANPEAEKESFLPDYNKEQSDKMREVNQKVVKFVAQSFTMPGTKDKYVLNKETNDYFDLAEYKEWNAAKGKLPLPEPIGNMTMVTDESTGKKKMKIKKY